MNSIWVLTAKIHFREGDFINDGWESYCRAFSDFNSAKREMRLLIKKYATDENDMFDGNGKITLFQDFADDYGYEHGFEDIQNFLQAFFTNENFPETTDNILEISEDDEDYNDCYIACKCDKNELLIHEGEDATMTELEPYIHTNAFMMDDSDKDYFVYISDLFSREQYGCPSRIYIDLKKVCIE
ncbi:MAG: hypothetical protein IIX54_00170 [Clostridia bacterium]|nr:hypothetical protein [Clostridia bacterium]